eukprot:s4307_g3.t1
MILRVPMEATSATVHLDARCWHLVARRQRFDPLSFRQTQTLCKFNSAKCSGWWWCRELLAGAKCLLRGMGLGQLPAFLAEPICLGLQGRLEALQATVNGSRPAHRVAVLGSHSLDFAATFRAVRSAGAIAAPAGMPSNYKRWMRAFMTLRNHGPGRSLGEPGAGDGGYG